MKGGRRAAVYETIDAEGRARFRLHGMLYGAACLAGLEWAAPPEARRYFAWRLRRGDLPIPLLLRSETIDILMASAWRDVGGPLRARLPQRNPRVRSRALRALNYPPPILARALFAGGASTFTPLMPPKPTGKDSLPALRHPR